MSGGPDRGVLGRATLAIGVLAVVGCEAVLGLGGETSLPGDAGDASGPDGRSGGSDARSTDAPRGSSGSGSASKHEDATVDSAEGPPCEAGTPGCNDAAEDAPSAGEIGAACTANADCKSAVCISATDLPGIRVGSPSVCSSVCCTDEDCPSGTACSPGSTGNFCVTAAAVAACGSSCGGPCCTGADCATQSAPFCALVMTPAGNSVQACKMMSESPSCQSSQQCLGMGGDVCFIDSDCYNGICLPIDTGGACNAGHGCSCLADPPCCRSSDCTGGTTCQWLAAADGSGDMLAFRGCEAATGTKQAGDSCSSDSVCSGGICAAAPGASGGLCTEPCCRDSDCSGLQGWTCRPYDAVVSAGSVTLLVCQPP